MLVDAILKLLVATNFLPDTPPSPTPIHPSPTKIPFPFPFGPKAVLISSTTSAPTTSIPISTSTTSEYSQDAPWIVLANQYYLRKIPWPTEYNAGNATILSSQFKDATLVDFDRKRNELFVGDVAANQIYSLTYTQNGSRHVFLDPEGTQTLNGTRVASEGMENMAVDWLNEKLYILNKHKRKLMVCYLNGSLCSTLLYNEFVDPRGLVLYPRKGYLFYSDVSTTPHISRTGLDGGHHISIVKEDILWPGGLALDKTEDRLYWGDAYFDEIWSVDLDGKDRKRLQIAPGGLSHVFDLDIFGDWIIWSDWNLKQLIRANKNTGDNQEVLWTGIQLVNGFKVVSQSTQPDYSDWAHPCADNNGGCSHHCLSRPGGDSKACVCPDTMKLSSDGVTCVSDCKSTQWEFKCGQVWSNSECIDRNLICDGTIDCVNGADERDCNSRSCAAGQYQCESDGNCVASSGVCDGRRDCVDGSDERGCAERKCGKFEFKCPSGACIGRHQLCDRSPDCSDGSDEFPQVCLNRTQTCAHYQFKCGDGRCIKQDEVCNGFLDCDDQTDEPVQTCLAAVNQDGCNRGWTRCGDVSYQCIRIADMCDGKVECARQEDEITETCSKHQCGSDQFKCKSNFRCIPMRWLCDADDDCGDGSDEAPEQCNGIKRPCSELEFRCPTSGKCIHQYLVCNGRPQCPHEEDENPEFCKKSWSCPRGFSKCTEGHCIPEEKWCDRRRDCVDLSDETNCTGVVRQPCDRRVELECGNSICVPRSYVCDGDDDCGDKSDETSPHCTQQQCQKTQGLTSGFWCSGTQVCIGALRLCNGVNDCGDNSDESPQLCSQQGGVPQSFAGFPGAPFLAGPGSRPGGQTQIGTGQGARAPLFPQTPPRGGPQPPPRTGQDRSGGFRGFQIAGGQGGQGQGQSTPFRGPPPKQGGSGPPPRSNQGGSGAPRGFQIAGGQGQAFPFILGGPRPGTGPGGSGGTGDNRTNSGSGSNSAPRGFQIAGGSPNQPFANPGPGRGGSGQGNTGTAPRGFQIAGAGPGFPPVRRAGTPAPRSGTGNAGQGNSGSAPRGFQIAGFPPIRQAGNSAPSNNTTTGNSGQGKSSPAPRAFQIAGFPPIRQAATPAPRSNSG